MNETRSPALDLIRHFDANQGHGMGRSRQRWEEGTCAATRLAIHYGLRFELGDFDKLAQGVYCADEWDYALACGIGNSSREWPNLSAALAYEAWKKRKPFLIREPSEKTPKRICEGRRFSWYGQAIKCTSIQGDFLVACTYKPDQTGEYSRAKIAKRIKINREQIREYHRELANREKRRAGGMP